MEDDPLKMTLSQLLNAVVERRSQDDWVSIRNDNYPWRRIVAAASRGECEVSRVGRQLMMQRAELNRFLAANLIPKRVEAKAEPPKGEFGDSVQRALRRYR